MIRDYEAGDEKRVKFNRFSDPSTAPDVFEDRSYTKTTVENGGEVRAIIVWKEVEPRDYASFIILSDKATKRDCLELKKLVNDAIVRLKPKLVLTYSIDCDELNRWHDFIGFKKEGDGVLIGDKNLTRWVMRWE